MGDYYYIDILVKDKKGALFLGQVISDNKPFVVYYWLLMED